MFSQSATLHNPNNNQNNDTDTSSISNLRGLSPATRQSIAYQLLVKAIRNNKNEQAQQSVSNKKILRKKILSSLLDIHDNDEINLEVSIHILHRGNILKVLSTYQQTKQKIHNKSLVKCETRIKQEAKFIYYLWKIIAKDTISGKLLKQIILLFNLQTDKKHIQESIKEMYLQQQVELEEAATQNYIRSLVMCWTNLRNDKHFYQPRVIDQHRKKSQETSKQKRKNKAVNKRIYQQQKIRKNLQKSSQQKKLAQLDFYEQTNNRNYPFRLKNMRNLANYQSQGSRRDRCNTQHCQTTASELNINENKENHLNWNSKDQENLVKRLYQKEKHYRNQRQRLKTVNDEQNQTKRLKQCTFRPKILNKSKSASSKFNNTSVVNRNLSSTNLQKLQGNIQRSVSVKGFDTAVKRMKKGQAKSSTQKMLSSYYSRGQRYQQLREMPINPPKFLSRQKQACMKDQITLFTIEFTVGKHKISVKVLPTDTEISISKNLAKIYGLKKEEERQIKNIVSMQLNNYFRQLAQQQDSRRFEQF